MFFNTLSMQQFFGNCFCQLGFLAAILTYFELVGYFGGECLVFIFGLFLSDLAVLVHPLELITRGKRVSKESNETSSQPSETNPGALRKEELPESQV